mgnify:CR=1 FL=1
MIIDLVVQIILLRILVSSLLLLLLVGILFGLEFEQEKAKKILMCYVINLFVFFAFVCLVLTVLLIRLGVVVVRYNLGMGLL